MWSCTFTDYENLWTNGNAVTPRPSWPASPDVDIPISTTPPLNENETDHNAMEFPLWRQFGKEFLIKNNINNWVVCARTQEVWLNGKMVMSVVRSSSAWQARVQMCHRLHNSYLDIADRL